MARRSTLAAEPISTRVLAVKVAQEIARAIVRVTVQDVCNCGGAESLNKCVNQELERPEFNGQPMTVHNLILCKLLRVGRGSWVPELKIITCVVANNRK